MDVRVVLLHGLPAELPGGGRPGTPHHPLHPLVLQAQGRQTSYVDLNDPVELTTWRAATSTHQLFNHTFQIIDLNLLKEFHIRCLQGPGTAWNLSPPPPSTS